MSQALVRGIIVLYGIATQGKRKFTPVMVKRLEKLGIAGRDPDELSQEDRTRFARLDINPDTISWKRVMDINDRY